MTANERAAQSVMVGERLAAARTAAGLSREHAAALAGVSEQSLANYETSTPFSSRSGKNLRMNVSALYALAGVYGVSCDYLLGLSGSPTVDATTRGVENALSLSPEAAGNLRMVCADNFLRETLERLLCSAAFDGIKTALHSAADAHRHGEEAAKELYRTIGAQSHAKDLLRHTGAVILTAGEAVSYYSHKAGNLFSNWFEHNLLDILKREGGSGNG